MEIPKRLSILSQSFNPEKRAYVRVYVNIIEIINIFHIK